MMKQEIWGYLLTHYAISALICAAATNAGIDPDRVKFKRTVRIIRRRGADPATPASSRRPPQLLPRQETQPRRHPPHRPSHDQACQPRPHQGKDQHSSMAK